VQELHITAVLFGSLVRRRLVAGGALATALRCVAEVRTNLESPVLSLCHVCESESVSHLRHLSLIPSWWCHKRTKHLCCIDETGNDKDMFPVQAARSPPGSKLSRFALDALAQFRDELTSWPDFCATLLQVGLTVAHCRTRAITVNLRLCELWCLLPIIPFAVPKPALSYAWYVCNCIRIQGLTYTNDETITVLVHSVVVSHMAAQ